MRRWVVAVAAVVAAACTPIGPRSDADHELGAPLPEPADGDLFAYLPGVERLSIGDPVPTTRFIDARGETLDLEGLAGRVVVLTFVAPPGRAGDTPEPLARLIDVSAQLGDRLAATTTFAVLLIDDGPEPGRRLGQLVAHKPDDGHDWRFLRAGPEATARLAAAFGIVLWRDAGGAARHTLGTVVIDGGGRYVDHFPGLDEWSPIEVVAAVAAAVDRGPG